jgi:hypothetical protein
MEVVENKKVRHLSLGFCEKGKNCSRSSKPTHAQDLNQAIGKTNVYHLEMAKLPVLVSNVCSQSQPYLDLKLKKFHIVNYFIQHGCLVCLLASKMICHVILFNSYFQSKR